MSEEYYPKFCTICEEEADWRIKGTPFHVCSICKIKHIEKSVELILIRALKEK